MWGLRYKSEDEPPTTLDCFLNEREYLLGTTIKICEAQSNVVMRVKLFFNLFMHGMFNNHNFYEMFFEQKHRPIGIFSIRCSEYLSRRKSETKARGERKSFIFTLKCLFNIFLLQLLQLDNIRLILYTCLYFKYWFHKLFIMKHNPM